MKRIFALTCIILSIHLNAQTGIGTNAPNASAKLDVYSTNKGFLPPRISLSGTLDVSTITNPATGLVVFNTATAGTTPNNVIPGYYYYDGTKWNQLVDQSSLNSFSGFNPNYAQSNASAVTKNAVGDIIVSQSITTSGRPIQIIASGDANPQNASSWCQLQLYRDGTALGKKLQAESSASNENIPYCLNYIDNPTAGTYTYSVKITGIPSGHSFQFGEADGNQITLLELGAWSAGTMPVSKGGTGNSSYTAGSVMFSDGSNITQDNANLFWDNSNNRIGIGTSSPSYNLDVNGTAKVATTPSITTASKVLVKDPSTSQISEQPISYITGVAKFILNTSQAVSNGSTIVLNSTIVNTVLDYVSLNTTTGLITLQPGTYELNGSAGSLNGTANNNGDARVYSMFYIGSSYVGSGGVSETGPAGNWNGMPQNQANHILTVPVGQTAQIYFKALVVSNVASLSALGDFGSNGDAGRAWVVVRKYN